VGIDTDRNLFQPEAVPKFEFSWTKTGDIIDTSTVTPAIATPEFGSLAVLIGAVSVSSVVIGFRFFMSRMRR
jgi:hypothetical protein